MSYYTLGEDVSRDVVLFILKSGMQQHYIFALIGIVYKYEYYLGGNDDEPKNCCAKSNKYLFYPLS